MTKEQEIAIEMLEYVKHHNTLIGYKNNERDKLAEIALNLIQEQDNLIDELSYKLADYIMYYDYDKCRNPDMIKNKAEELKQFYERKVEDESDDKSTYGK